ncbi:MAG: hypothetical protein ACTSYD_06705 [Candidatus Heimdallarchaeaceae archaeon]
MKSYLKFYGPSISKAKKAVTEMCLKSDVITIDSYQLPIIPEAKTTPLLPTKIGEQMNLIDWGIAVEWKQEPSIDDIKRLVKQLDKCIEPTGARYTITTIKDTLSPPIPELSVPLPEDMSSPYAITFLKVYGPPLHKAFDVVDNIVAKFTEIIQGSLLTSHSGPQIGIFDFALVWKHLPKNDLLFQLEEDLDEAFSKTGLIYSIQTRSYE